MALLNALAIPRRFSTLVSESWSARKDRSAVALDFSVTSCNEPSILSPASVALTRKHFEPLSPGTGLPWISISSSFVMHNLMQLGPGAVGEILLPGIGAIGQHIRSQHADKGGVGTREAATQVEGEEADRHGRVGVLQ